ncbi:bifunctional riboflavin kinase/FAD synthetase [Acetonema longum]|uniref:Riboflavin biosynthesis protein n=1 Tax=Acetonema longum DSM 6540 TaxID=1009370 RepID=F7NL98_9FIRM|nr:bifunctional riboflavin kinase/FAD synthetase [Acetonema longum]EGO63203.1 FAD synthase [Acetonema longum DSM 6540]
MKLFTQIEKIDKSVSNIAIALGTFDGVHVGHQRIIGKTVAYAKKQQGTSAVLTFSNHPMSIIDPRHNPLQITSMQQKIDLIAEIGVDLLFFVPFTAELLKFQPRQFIQFLMQHIRPSQVVVGPNFSFGYQGKGSPDMLRVFGQEFGFAVDVHEAVFLEDRMVSSTAIRQLILEGNVELARKLLGRPLRLSGPVVSGQQRGRLLGFPTANLSLPERTAIPRDGVYAVRANIGADSYQGVANIGTNPTFSGQCRRLETHIFDFARDIYGEMISVDFLTRIRGEVTFANADQLQAQISSDIVQARRYFDHVDQTG